MDSIELLLLNNFLDIHGSICKNDIINYYIKSPIPPSILARIFCDIFPEEKEFLLVSVRTLKKYELHEVYNLIKKIIEIEIYKPNTKEKIVRFLHNLSNYEKYYNEVIDLCSFK